MSVRDYVQETREKRNKTATLSAVRSSSDPPPPPFSVFGGWFSGIGARLTVFLDLPDEGIFS